MYIYKDIGGTSIELTVYDSPIPDGTDIAKIPV